MKLLTVYETAERLGIKVPTVRLWIAKRLMAHTKLGRCVRVPEAEVNRLISQNFIPAREVRDGR